MRSQYKPCRARHLISRWLTFLYLNVHSPATTLSRSLFCASRIIRANWNGIRASTGFRLTSKGFVATARTVAKCGHVVRCRTNTKYLSQQRDTNLCLTIRPQLIANVVFSHTGHGPRNAGRVPPDSTCAWASVGRVRAARAHEQDDASEVYRACETFMAGRQRGCRRKQPAFRQQRGYVAR